MRPLVIGTGVAGTVAALALHKVGFEPQIFEAYDRSAGLAHGVYLTVAVNGVDALRAVDAHDLVLTKGFPSAEITFYSGTGRRLGAIPMGPERPDGLVTHTIRRSDLYGGLYDEVRRRGIPIHHGKRLVGAENLADGRVRAVFADGTSAEGDLLIGADGVHSVTRSLIDPANPGPRYTGLGNTGGFTSDVEGLSGDDKADEKADYVMVWGRDCFFGYTVSPSGEVWWFANPPSKTEVAAGDAADRADIRERLLSLLAPDRTPGIDLVRATSGPIPLTNQYDLPRVPTWRTDRMVLIGDAAHAVAPASGQGASLAAEDAVVLARCLRVSGSTVDGLARYEEERRERVQRVVAWGSSMNNTKKQGPVGRVLRDIALPFILRKAARPAALSSMAWLFEHHVDLEASSPEPSRTPGPPR
jgi:2-polyprenyl-6-methoxyphenol hydroxylase-like FAD-dependent oxidoreductase